MGIGTGRIAIPLAARGVMVQGIESSTAMIEGLSKPGFDATELVVGSFSDLSQQDKLSLIYVAFNMLIALLTSGDQILCLRSAAAHPEQERRFLVEAFVPDLRRCSRGSKVIAVDVGEDRIRLDVAWLDRAVQS